MKQCPRCQRRYDDSQNYCRLDGTPLESDATPRYSREAEQPPEKEQEELAGEEKGNKR